MSLWKGKVLFLHSIKMQPLIRLHFLIWLMRTEQSQEGADCILLLEQLQIRASSSMGPACWFQHNLMADALCLPRFREDDKEEGKHLSNSRVSVRFQNVNSMLVAKTLHSSLSEISHQIECKTCLHTSCRGSCYTERHLENIIMECSTVRR